MKLLFRFFGMMFGLLLFSQIVIVPLVNGLGDIAGERTNSTNLTTNTTTNITSLSTSDFNAGTNCAHFDIRIPIPFTGISVSVLVFDLCMPKFLNDLGNIVDDEGNVRSTAVESFMTVLAIMIGAIVLVAIVTAVAGYVTGGASVHTASMLLLVLVLGTFLVLLMAGTYPMFALLGGIGTGLWIMVGFLGILLVVLNTVAPSGGGL